MAYLAPAGTPVGLRDIIRLLPKPGANNAIAEFAASLAKMLDCNRAWLFSSGRASLAILLKVLAEAAPPDRREIVLPAYTCYSVAAAVVRSGLRPRLADLDPETLDFSPNALGRIDTEKTLAIISSNLYGVPNDLVRMEEFSRSRGIFLIDDAAQAFGSRFAGRAVGSFGDAGILSFDKGKNITTVEGGAVAVRSPTFSESMDRHYAQLPRKSATLAFIVKACAISLGLRPIFYDVVRRLPGLGLGLTCYDPSFPIHRYPPELASLGTRMIERLHTLNEARNRVAYGLQQVLPSSRVRFITVHPDAEPAYTRFPCLVDPAQRAGIIAALHRSGIGATSSYPLALCDIPALRSTLHTADLEMSGARLLAASIVTLPTHAYCRGDFLARVSRAMNEAPG